MNIIELAIAFALGHYLAKVAYRVTDEYIRARQHNQRIVGLVHRRVKAPLS